ncbi:MAG: hypothetical protein R2708_05185 [Vicinamibacterales bacterium]
MIFFEDDMLLHESAGLCPQRAAHECGANLLGASHRDPAERAALDFLKLVVCKVYGDHRKN